MRELAPRFRAGYGAGPWHLILTLVCLTVTGWVVLRLAGETGAERMLAWFVGAAVAHDLFLFPIYATADAALRRLLRVNGHAAPAARVSAVNHIRVPALAAGLLLLVYLPGILGQGRATYLAATSQDRQAQLTRWLAITGIMFLASAVWYAIRVRRLPRKPG
ncbi:hypothetical protein GA0070624_4596 [Micromonospora rhizosphaerae]|uniref:Uncharacterized protein n=1 Tax=Micromonospora rhizosphaerae TaxID=568872 RepID=A0A1C6STQ7_9ACTN|nr:hypothetical protein [Micromonospora rhizosphaerae]SCL32900.1 hypothetical protein GA0070624_4596 [Micromonospora rhizosphaerae]